MKCLNCGEALSDGVFFCKECGCKIEQVPQRRFCRECGAELEIRGKFCSMCGSRVLTEEDIANGYVFDAPSYEDVWDERDNEIVNPPSDDVKAPVNSKLKKTFHKFWNSLDGFTKSCIIAGSFFLFALMISWIAHKPLALIASLIQIVLICVLCGIHIGIIKTDNRWLSWVLPIIILIMASTYIEDFKPKSNSTPSNNITVESTAPATTEAAKATTQATELIETTAYILADDEIRIDFNRYAFIASHYKDVTYRLEKLGFTNISYRIQYDIVWGITPEGQVASVSIAGISNYQSGDVFKNNDPVVIAYHMKTEDNPNKVITETVASSKAESETTEGHIPATENSSIEDESEIITVENNEDFKALLDLDSLDPIKQSQFATKYKNRIIEFDCFVYYMEQNSKYKTLWSYVFVPGDSDNLTGTVLFGLENASFQVFKWDSKTKPSYLQLGSKIRIRAEIVGANDMYIKLKPVCTWGR